MSWTGWDSDENRWTFKPFVFFDWTWLQLLEPLPEQEEYISLLGSGFGFQGGIKSDFSPFKGKFTYEVDLGWPLEETDYTDAGDLYAYFNVSYQF
jgi:hemolysin activation/secretion protein